MFYQTPYEQLVMDFVPNGAGRGLIATPRVPIVENHENFSRKTGRNMAGEKVSGDPRQWTGQVSGFERVPNTGNEKWPTK